MASAPWFVSDEFWGRIAPEPPRPERRFRYPGRRRLDDRAALQGILFVLYTASRWRHLPLQLGFGSGSTFYRRMVDWQQAGVWERVRALARRASLPPVRSSGKGGRGFQPCASEKGAWTVTGGNRDDVTQLIPLIERVPPVRGRPGAPRRRPDRITADRGYGHDKSRRELRKRRIRPEIARRQTEHGSGLGGVRWIVERIFAWLHKLKRLLVRYDRRAEIHEPSSQSAAASSASGGCTRHCDSISKRVVGDLGRRCGRPGHFIPRKAYRTLPNTGPRTAGRSHSTTTPAPFHAPLPLSESAAPSR
jgi:transposase